MFNQISDILSKFTPQQRVLALVLLLSTTVILTFGGHAIESFNQSDRVLQDKITRLEASQKILLGENDSLYKNLTASRLQCTRDIMDVRRKLLADLGVLEKTLERSTETYVLPEVVSSYKYVDNFGDTAVMAAMPAPPTPVRKQDNTSQLLLGIQKLKAEIKKDLK